MEINIDENNINLDNVSIEDKSEKSNNKDWKLGNFETDENNNNINEYFEESSIGLEVVEQVQTDM